MKKKRWKLAGIFLMAALTVPSLGGCKVGNTQIRLSSGQLRNHNAIVRINDHKYDIRYSKTVFVQITSKPVMAKRMERISGNPMMRI